MKKDQQYDLMVKVGLARISACICEAARLSESAYKASRVSAFMSLVKPLREPDEQRALALFVAYKTTVMALREAADRFDQAARYVNSALKESIPAELADGAQRDQAGDRLGWDVLDSIIDDLYEAREDILNSISSMNDLQYEAVLAKWKEAEECPVPNDGSNDTECSPDR